MMDGGRRLACEDMAASCEMDGGRGAEVGERRLACEDMAASCETDGRRGSEAGERCGASLWILPRKAEDERATGSRPSQAALESAVGRSPDEAGERRLA
ncbi:hypothetical protein PF001_g32864 [Phytophthora fragariae]|uniref:Uncharacterized protein n=2 Tax=Phytophthora fragariae TaxID=53985 RepID=A0A6A4AQX9_9STRA|nr:hypothetical protein PF003_g33448 [Phytophthora fragariae]KAE9259969.1 hypothetical protein PF001_g32864 [Phytophthora fragariae]KAE9361445.1 hypothetical protein PF008_g1048 [Phytophthora fragariae]